jgi:hypothetical protein
MKINNYKILNLESEKLYFEYQIKVLENKLKYSETMNINSTDLLVEIEELEKQIKIVNSEIKELQFPLIISKIKPITKEEWNKFETINEIPF